MHRHLFYALLVLLLLPGSAGAQRGVALYDSLEQYIFSFSEIESLEDPTGTLTIQDVSSGRFDKQFQPSAIFSPLNYDRDSYYWYRVKIIHEPTRKRWQLEFFDQTIDHIEVYLPNNDGSFDKRSFGDELTFGTRPIKHKNFVVMLPDDYTGEHTYYFKVRSQQEANILIVLRETDYFFHYAIDEYFFFGIFYGMILVFCFYNLLMFVAVHERHYLYYVLYLISVGLYEMSADGIAFQYLWPDAVRWNQYAPGFALYFASTFALLFAGSLLNVRKQYPFILKLLTGAFALRTTFLIAGLTVAPSLLYARFIEVLPFSAAFFAGIYALKTGYRPARFLVVGYSFLFAGIILKGSQYIGFNWFPLGDLTHYSLGFSFIMEMMFLSFAISDKIKLLRVDKEIAQQKTIEQLRENQKLKDTLNEELEEQVKIKTKELVLANQQLARQSEEISAMNALLAQDNVQLKHDVEVVTEARILSRDVDFEEFSAMYPDDDSCLKFLGHIKWQHGFSCMKCSHKNYSAGRSPYSRRCTKCGYDESVTAFTILQNTRLPINKAFYMIFLVYSTKGNISSHKLSEILHIRQSTCWAYSSRIKKAMKEKHKNGAVRHEGWDSILFTENLIA